MDEVDRIFKVEDKSIDELMSDRDSRRLILKSVSSKIQDHPEILPKRPHENIIAATLNQDFADVDESMYVAGMISKYIRAIGVLIPNDLHILMEARKVNEREILNYAQRCFISLVFFRERMKHEYDRRVYPSPDYYRNFSINTFSSRGMHDLAEHHKLWEEHLPIELRLN